MHCTTRKRSAATSAALSAFEAGAVTSTCFLGLLRPRDGVTSSGSLRVTTAAFLGVLEEDAIGGVPDALKGVVSLVFVFSAGC